MKKKLKTIVAATALLLAVCLVLTACKPAETGLTKITVSEVTHSVFYAPQYAAMALGYFEEEGLEIDLSVGQGADKVMAAVLSGGVDIGFAGPEASIYVYNEGKEDYSVVFAQVTKRDGSFLIGREPEFDWQDLEGKTVLPGRKGGVPYMTFEYVVKQQGLVPGEDVIFDDSVQFALMTSAFASGTGDFVTAFEPTASMLEAEGKGYIVASIGEDSGEIPYTAYFASKSFIEKNPETIQKFVNAIYRAQKWINETSSEEVAEVIAPLFADTDVELLAASIERYKSIDAYSQNPLMTEESFEMLQTVMAEAGELDQKAPFAYVVDNTFAQVAVETLK